MFLKAVTELAIDFEAVRVEMLDQPERWLGTLAEAARDDHHRLLVGVGVGKDGGRFRRAAMLSVGKPLSLDGRVVSLPVRLRMADHAELFPVLEGDLGAAWLGPGRTHLALAVQYDAPFGLLGLVADGALLHRVAEVVVQRLLEAVGGQLAARCAQAASHPPVGGRPARLQPPAGA